MTRLAVMTLYHPLLFRGGAQQAAFGLFRQLREEKADCIFVAADPPRPGAAARADAYVRPSGIGPGEYLYACGHYDHFWQRGTNALAKRALLDFLGEAGVTHVFLSHFMHFGIDLIPLLKDRGLVVHVGFHEMLAACHANGQMVTRNTGELCSTSAPERCAQCFPDIATDLFYLRNAYFRDSLAAADGFVSPSDFLRGRLVEWGLDPGKFSVVQHGVDAADFRSTLSVASRIGAGEAKDGGKPLVRFGYFGQLVDNKGVHTLLQAAKLLDKASPVDFQVHINGANLDHASPQFREKFAAALDDSKTWTRGAVVMNGPYLHDTLPLRMAQLDVVVVPSLWWEIYCMVVDEAKFLGKPVIASAIGGIPERLEDGVDGFLVSPGDVVGLAQAMERFKNGLELKPRAPVDQSWPRIAEQYLALFFGDGSAPTRRASASTAAC